MESIVITRTWNKNAQVRVDNLSGTVFCGEAGAHTFEIIGQNGTETVQITGTITARALLSNGVTEVINGSLADGKALVTLTGVCYSVPGRIVISIFSEEDGKNICIYCGVGTVFRTTSDQVAYPSAAIPDIQELIDELQEVIDEVPADIAAIEAAGSAQVAAVQAQGAATIASIPQDYTSLSNEVGDLKSAVGFTSPTLVRVANKYINSAGNVATSNGFSYTEPVAVKKGDYIVLTAAGASQWVSMICECDSEGAILAVAVLSADDSNVRDYTYLMPHDGYVCFSFMHTKSYGVKITNNATAFDARETLKVTQDVSGTNLLPMEIGNIAFASSGWTYSGSTSRLRTLAGYSLKCSKGDRIKMSAYTGVRFSFSWKRADGTYRFTDWMQRDFVAPEDGEYVMVATLVPEATITDITAITSLLQYEITRTIDDTYTYFNDKHAYISKKTSGLHNPLLSPANARFILHRGLSTQAPENTIPAYTLAGKEHPFGIECDVQETSDGVLVCLHDTDVSRMTDGTGNIYDMTYAEVQELTIDAGSNIDQYPNLKIPTFADYLKVCRRYGCVACVDIKYVTNYGTMANTVKKYGMDGSCIYLTDGEFGVKSVRKYTDAPIFLFGYSGTSISDLLAIAENYDDVWVEPVNTEITSQAQVDAAHNKNIPVATYTISNTTASETMFGYGVDVIASDNIAKLSD